MKGHFKTHTCSHKCIFLCPSIYHINSNLNLYPCTYWFRESIDWFTDTIIIFMIVVACHQKIKKSYLKMNGITTSDELHIPYLLYFLSWKNNKSWACQHRRFFIFDATFIIFNVTKVFEHNVTHLGLQIIRHYALLA